MGGLTMKKTLLLLTIAASVAALAGCNNLDEPREEVTSTRPKVLHASFEEPAMTRAGFDYDASAKTYSHYWEEGDHIAFFPKEDRPDRYVCTDAGTGTFELDWHSRLNRKRADYTYNYAIYPHECPIGIMFNNFVDYDEEMVELLELDFGMGYPISFTDPPVLQVEVPYNETYAPGDSTYGYGNIMVARSADDQLRFKSVMGWLKVQLTGAAALKSVRVIADQSLGNITLSGPGRISFDSGGTPCLTMDTDQDLGAVRAYKTYSFGSNPLVLDPVNPTTVYLALPPTEFNHGFTVRLTYSDNTTSDLTTTRHISIVRNHVTPMSPRETKSMNATLAGGSSFNAIVKRLANDGNGINFSMSETNVKGIAVQKGSSITSDYIVSADGSENPVYAVFDSETGVVTLHTPAYRIFLPSTADSFCYRMAGLAFIDWDELDGSNVTSAVNLFCGCTALRGIGDVILPNARNFNSAFSGCQNLETIGRVSLPEATNVYQAFYQCRKLASFGDIVFPKATNAGYLFYQCSLLADVGELSLPLATNAMNLFCGCSALTGIGDVILPEATGATALFSGCTALASVGTVSLPKATDVSQLFYGCRALTSFGDVSFSLALSASYLFRDCSSLTTVGDIDLPKVLNASYLLSGCPALTSVGDINLPKATNVSYLLGTGMSVNAYGCRLLTSDNLGTINVPLAQDASYMFRGCTALTSLDGLTLTSTSATNLEHMFDSCTSLESVDISGISGTITGIAGMFYDCSSLGNVTFSESLNTASVTNMNGVFYNCRSMTAIDVSGFSTANVTDMAKMFQGCSGISTLDLSGFSFANVITAEYMFSGCTSLTTLGSDTHLTGNVLQRCSYMFNDCRQLGNVDISGLKGTLQGSNTYSSPSLSHMFYNCSRMTTIRFNAELYTDAVYDYGSIFENCSSLTQLYIKGFYLKELSNDNPAVRFMRSMTGVPSSCTVHYTAAPSFGTHAGCYSVPSMFAFYSSPNSFNWTTN